MSPGSYSFRTALTPAPPQMSKDEGPLPYSRSEVAAQWSRKPDTLLNEMVKGRGFLCRVHTRKLQGTVGGSEVARDRWAVKWVKDVVLLKTAVSAWMCQPLSLIRSVCVCV